MEEILEIVIIDKNINLFLAFPEQPPSRFTEVAYDRFYLRSPTTSGSGAEQQDLWRIPKLPLKQIKKIQGYANDYQALNNTAVIHNGKWCWKFGIVL